MQSSMNFVPEALFMTIVIQGMYFQYLHLTHCVVALAQGFRGFRTMVLNIENTFLFLFRFGSMAGPAS